MKNRKNLNPMVVMGLGNPGAQYVSTRHNVGYRVVDDMMRKYRIVFRKWRFSWVFHAEVSGDGIGRSILFIRWSGYMNESGAAVSYLRKKHQINPDDFYAVVDNMDLPPGTCRLKSSGGDAGHKGLKSLIRAFGCETFNRVYIGIGRPEAGLSVIDHVLGRPGKRDGIAIEDACHKATVALWALRTKSFEKVVESINRRKPT